MRTSIIYGTSSLAIVVAVLAVVLRLWPRLARSVLGNDDAGRDAGLDGTRGVLGIAVLLHHTVIMRMFCTNGVWDAPPSAFDRFAGQGSVATFFMISAYLFWGRVIRSQGQLDWMAFYRGRVRRIVPMYLVTLAVLAFVVAVETHWQWKCSPKDVAEQIFRWASFGIFDSGDINGLSRTFVIFSVSWTLHIEWAFYAFLPLVAATCSKAPWRYLAYALVLYVGNWSFENRDAAYFVCGAIAIDVIPFFRKKRWLEYLTAAAGVAAFYYLIVKTPNIYVPEAQASLFVIFVAAVVSRGPWALLRTRPFRFLGHISYSVYLLHNPVIYMVSSWGLGRDKFAKGTDPRFYEYMVLIAFVTIAVSTVTYLFVEKPLLYPRAPGEPSWLGSRIRALVDRSRASNAERPGISEAVAE